MTKIRFVQTDTARVFFCHIVCMTYCIVCDLRKLNIKECSTFSSAPFMQNKQILLSPKTLDTWQNTVEDTYSLENRALGVGFELQQNSSLIIVLQ